MKKLCTNPTCSLNGIEVDIPKDRTECVSCKKDLKPADVFGDLFDTLDDTFDRIDKIFGKKS